jgi:hypothetical protein
LINIETFKKGIDDLISFRNLVAPFGQGLKENINKEISSIKKKKEAQRASSTNASVIDEQIKYIDEKLKD